MVNRGIQRPTTNQRRNTRGFCSCQACKQLKPNPGTSKLQPEPIKEVIVGSLPRNGNRMAKHTRPTTIYICASRVLGRWLLAAGLAKLNTRRHKGAKIML